MGKNGYSSQALSAICSNLAKASEKQHRQREFSLFKELVEFFEGEVKTTKKGSMDDLNVSINEDIEHHYEQIGSLASEVGDRGALRCVTWGKKVTAIQKSLLSRYEKQ
jgi:hypothetical protein